MFEFFFLIPNQFNRLVCCLHKMMCDNNRFICIFCLNPRSLAPDPADDVIVGRLIENENPEAVLRLLGFTNIYVIGTICCSSELQLKPQQHLMNQ